MTEQMDMFGGATELVDPPPKSPKKKDKHADLPHCWRDCALCLPALSSDHGTRAPDRVYRVCRPPGLSPMKSYEDSLCCDLAVSRLAPTEPGSPLSVGWEDY